MSQPQESELPDISRPEVREELLSEYRRLRAASMQLNNQLVARLSGDIINEGGKKLGILEGRNIYAESMEHLSILMDYCIYNVPRKGRNTFEKHLEESPPAPGSDEMLCLEAMQRATYSLIVVEKAIRGFGMVVRGLHSDKPVLLIDQGLGTSTDPGFVIATRLLPFEKFSVTGGAALPLGVLPASKRDEILKIVNTEFGDMGTPGFDPVKLIRLGLARGADSHIEYRNAGESPTAPPPSRNSPCPCGSGKKYKHCCLKKR